MNLRNDLYFIKQEELLSEIEIQDRVIKSYEKAVYENIGQILSLAKMQLFTIDLEKTNESQIKINNSGKLIGKAIHDLRYITKQLGPKEIIEKGFAFAIEFELQRIKHSKGYETDFNLNGPFFRLDDEKELLMFNILQELLNIPALPLSKLVVRVRYSLNELKVKINYLSKDIGVLSKDLINKNTKLNDRLKLIEAEWSVKSDHGNGTISITIKR